MGRSPRGAPVTGRTAELELAVAGQDERNARLTAVRAGPSRPERVFTVTRRRLLRVNMLTSPASSGWTARSSTPGRSSPSAIARGDGWTNHRVLRGWLDHSR